VAKSVAENIRANGAKKEYVETREDVYHGRAKIPVAFKPARGRFYEFVEVPKASNLARPDTVVVIFGKFDGFIKPVDFLVKLAANENAAAYSVGMKMAKKMAVGVVHAEKESGHDAIRRLDVRAGDVEVPPFDFAYRALKKSVVG
jgi:hypothetical protein